jgi:alkylation response protein AidB-like acyl-CoA dehydrogenase
MPWTYDAPLADMRFVLEHVLDAPAAWARCGRHAELDMDTAASVLDEAAKFASGVLLPLNAAGDAQGCRIEAGRVRTPDGYAAAYRAYVDGGWAALAGEPAWGGQGLPLLLDAAVREMLAACNHGWVMYPDLLHGACETLLHHGSEALKDRYLARLVSGEWLAAMALTEPQAGSDLGALRTRAEPQADGSLRISGSKIFISGGDHDLTDNVVDLVLCRLPDAPPGSKGLSLALVPAVLPDGSRNAMQADGLEHKLGIHGSATCAMRYEAATGWLVGEPHRGLAAMFLMMNSARLHVGLQGLGHQEIAAQNARRHAAERVQFGQPIARQPAMRQALLRGQALAEAHRVIAYRAALALDRAALHDDPAVRAAEQRMAALLTPVVKACLTDQGFAGASAALQVFGGYGYVEETGIAQVLRDSRIAMVYEGTNEIQAIDLVQRKLLADGGAGWQAWAAEAGAEAARCDAGGDPTCGVLAAALRAQLEAADAGLQALAGHARADAQAPLALAHDVLQGVHHALLAWAFAASARAAAGHPDTAWAQARTARMRWAAEWLLPQGLLHWRRVAGGAPALPLVC